MGNIQSNFIFIFIVLNLILCYFFLKFNPKIIKNEHYTHGEKINENAKKIPKVMYKTGPISYDRLSPDVLKVFNNTLTNNKGLKIEYFDNEQCSKFIEENFDKTVLEAYKALIPGAYKADLFRYCILYLNGGIYSDLTQVFRVSLDELIDFKNDKIVLVDDVQLRNQSFPGIQINFIATRPKMIIFKKAIQSIVKNIRNHYYGSTALDPTGPTLFRKELMKLKSVKPRIDLVQVHNKFIDNHEGFVSCVVFKQNKDKIAYINKLPNHDLHILKSNKNSYGSLWREKKIYTPSVLNLL